MRILIVDDHAVVRRGLREIVEDLIGGVEVAEATDTGTALEAMRRHDWDLVLLDLNLPGRGGLEVLRRSRELRPAVPILVLSMHAEESHGVRVIKAGAAGYVNKECAPEELAGAVRQVASGGRYIGPRLAQALAAAVQSAAGGAELSHREFQVLCLLGAGRTVTQAAIELSLSIKTISTYRTRLLGKLGLASTAELIRYAVAHGLSGATDEPVASRSRETPGSGL
jgi:DNA-binding NarL/FixJ family response regulator